VAAGQPFEFMEYPNRTHCICQGKGTTVHLFEMMTRFLDRTLMRSGAESPSRARAAAGQ
jgi:dipeptidyl-peptidase-4